MIDVRNLAFAYGDGPAIFDSFHWRAATHERWAVIGPSGCGKSTLLYLLAGLQQPRQGEVIIGGQRMLRPRPRTGLILQDYGLLPWETVAGNAALGLRVRRFYGPDGRHAPRGPHMPPAEIDARVDAWLERLGILSLRHKYPAQISGGQRQRTAIARTFVMNPDLLLMDEPFSSLDTFTRERLERLTLEVCAETGVTAVVVTHNIEEAVYLGRRLLVLRQPPHREALVLDNPGGGQPGFRDSTQFQERCSLVRGLLKETASAQA